MFVDCDQRAQMSMSDLHADAGRGPARQADLRKFVFDVCKLRERSLRTLYQDRSDCRRNHTLRSALEEFETQCML
jgi:hypothetical protein